MRRVDSAQRGGYLAASRSAGGRAPHSFSSVGGFRAMKIRNSLKSAKARDKNCVVVRRRGRLYVLNKKNPRMKARQG
mgnify:CR=1 FL=1